MSTPGLIWRKKQDDDAVHTAWLMTMELHPTAAKPACEQTEAGGSNLQVSGPGCKLVSVCICKVVGAELMSRPLGSP